MATTRRRILLLTQSPSLEQEFKTALMAETAHNAGMQHHGVRLQVVAAPDGRTLGPLLRRGVDLVAFDLALSAEALAESVAALDEFRDVPVLGLGQADERWHQLLRGSPIEDLVEILGTIQNDLFHLGSELCMPAEERGEIEIPTLEQRHIEQLERWIDQWLDQLPALENFVLPGGGAAAANLHLARTVCRRAERAVVKLGRDEKIGECALRYLNRLSDLLFVMARWENSRRGREETTWDSRA